MKRVFWLRISRRKVLRMKPINEKGSALLECIFFVCLCLSSLTLFCGVLGTGVFSLLCRWHFSQFERELDHFVIAQKEDHWEANAGNVIKQRIIADVQTVLGKKKNWEKNISLRLFLKQKRATEIHQCYTLIVHICLPLIYSRLKEPADRNCLGQFSRASSLKVYHLKWEGRLECPIKFLG